MCNVSLRSVAGGISSGGFRSQREPPFFSSLATSLESLDLPHAPGRPRSGSALISRLRPPMRDSSWTRRRGRPRHGNRRTRYAEQDLVSDVADGSGLVVGNPVRRRVMQIRSRSLALSRSAGLLAARFLIWILAPMVSCGGSGAAPAIPGLSVGGTYDTTVTLLPAGNTCGNVTVQNNPLPQLQRGVLGWTTLVGRSDAAREGKIDPEGRSL